VSSAPLHAALRSLMRGQGEADGDWPVLAGQYAAMMYIGAAREAPGLSTASMPAEISCIEAYVKESTKVSARVAVDPRAQSTSAIFEVCPEELDALGDVVGHRGLVYYLVMRGDGTSLSVWSMSSTDVYHTTNHCPQWSVVSCGNLCIDNTRPASDAFRASSLWSHILGSLD
jgi:hypothetical protein